MIKPLQNPSLSPFPAANEAAMQARLKVLHDKANVKQVKLLPVTLIGRSTDCNLKIASSQVSRNHCRITVASDAVFVEDLGSANGTLVDGQLIPPHQPTVIAPGAHLVVGPAEFQIDYVASTSATVVLPRSGVMPSPDLSSTEMIFPQPVPAAAAASPAEVVSLAPAVAAAPVAPLAEATVSTPAAAVYAPPAAEATAQEVADASREESAYPELMESVADAIDGDAVPGPFEFGEAPVDSVSHASENPPPQRKRLTGLFSLFTRKSKSDVAAAEAEPVVGNAPGVFLPAVDVSQHEPGDPPEPELAVAAYAYEPVEADPASEIPADYETDPGDPADQGFQQFLSQFDGDEQP